MEDDAAGAGACTNLLDLPPLALRTVATAFWDDPRALGRLASSAPCLATIAREQDLWRGYAIERFGSNFLPPAPPIGERAAVEALAAWRARAECVFCFRHATRARCAAPAGSQRARRCARKRSRRGTFDAFEATLRAPPPCACGALQRSCGAVCSAMPPARRKAR